MSLTEVGRITGFSSSLVYYWVNKRGTGIKTKTEIASFRDHPNRAFTNENGEQVKICKVCGEEKLLTEFSKNGSSLDGRMITCKKCRSEKRKGEYLEDPSSHCERQRISRKNNPEAHRGYDMKKRFGLTPEMFKKMFEEQGSVCAACGSTDPGTPSGAWHVDHDHKCCDNISGKTCGKCVRAILCRWCNMALGNAKEDTNRLRKLADYVEKWALPTPTRPA